MSCTQSCRMQFWKEWRDHRSSLIGLWVMIPLTLLALAFYRGGTLLREQDADLLAGVFGGMACWFAIGCSLFGSEWNRKHGLWLARSPAGLHRTWLLKIVFLVSITLATGLWAMAATQGVTAAMGFAVETSGFGFEGLLWKHWWLLCTWAVWVLATSAWGVRPGLILIVAPLAATLFNAPLVGALLEKHWSFPEARVIDFVFSTLVGLATCSYAFTRYRPQTKNKVLGCAITMALVGHTPAYGAWAARYAEAFQLDLSGDRYEIREALISPNHQFAYLGVVPKYTPAPFAHRLVVDLRDGSFWSLDHHGVAWMGWAETKPTRPRDLLYSSERTLELPYYPDRDSKKPKHRYWVADTAQPGYEPAPPLPYFDWDRFAEGNPELAALDPFRLSQGVGFGYKVSYYGYAWQFPGRTNAYYDFTKNQVYPLHEGQKRMRAILPSTWVLQERVGEDTYLALYDPETQAAHPAPGLQANDQFVCATKSGCFLFERGQELFQFDPETQAVSTVTQLGRLLHEKHRAGEMSYSKLPIGGPSPPYLALGGDSYSHSKQIGWFDEQTLTLHWGAPIERSFQLIRFGEDAKAIGISMGRLIERIDWKTGERETLFPRPENIGGL